MANYNHTLYIAGPIQLTDTDWVGFSSSFPQRELISKECFLLTPPYRCRCLGTAALTSIHIHFRNEHPFSPFLFNLWENRETSLLNTIKTEANIHHMSHQESLSISSLLQHKCNKIMKRVRLSRRNRSLWSGTVTVEKTLLLCGHMYKILCDKPCKNK